MRDRAWWKTVVGVILTAVMLFPVYWMINVSLTPSGNMRKSPPNLIPIDATLAGYRSVLDQQLPFLGTSLIIGIGTVLLTLVLAAPAAYSLAKLRPRGGSGLSFVLLIAQMIPAIIMAMGFYAIYLNLGLLNSVPGLILADSTIAVGSAAEITEPPDPMTTSTRRRSLPSCTRTGPSGSITCRPAGVSHWLTGVA